MPFSRCGRTAMRPGFSPSITCGDWPRPRKASAKGEGNAAILVRWRAGKQKPPPGAQAVVRERKAGSVIVRVVRLRLMEQLAPVLRSAAIPRAEFSFRFAIILGLEEVRLRRLEVLVLDDGRRDEDDEIPLVL